MKKLFPLIINDENSILLLNINFEIFEIIQQQPIDKLVNLKFSQNLLFKKNKMIESNIKKRKGKMKGKILKN